MRTPSKVCRNGHKMTGDNLLWHARYDASGKRFYVRECRTCANERYRIKRKVERRNRRRDQAIHKEVVEEMKSKWGDLYEEVMGTAKGKDAGKAKAKAKRTRKPAV